MSLIRFLGLLTDERGATAIEYALIASLISIAIVTAATTVGTTLTNTFSTVANAL
jgi:pilus assembly protein Flp/PilA